MLPRLKPKNCLSIFLGSAILAFGLYNIHSISGVTEGGVLGLTLLLEHWLGISPSISGLVLNGACYLLGFKLLGREFIAYSIIAGGGFSAFYAIFELFPPLWPQIAQMPLLAAIAVALPVYAIAALRSGAVGAEDIEALPGGERAARLLGRAGLLRTFGMKKRKEMKK